jgi:hypothetical protein
VEGIINMREYKIKKGHKVDFDELLYKYFGAKGDIESGFKFDAGDIGSVFIQKKGMSLFIDVDPPKVKCGDFNAIKKWNNFLFEATGKTAKERKKELMKV